MRKIACSIILITSLNAVAQTASLTSAPVNTVKTNVVPGLMNVNPSKVFGSLSVGYNSNLYERNSYKSEKNTSADLLINFRASGSNIIRAYAGGTQAQTQGREARLVDGYTAWVNDGFWTRGKITTVGQQIRLAVPMS